MDNQQFKQIKNGFGPEKHPVQIPKMPQPIEQPQTTEQVQLAEQPPEKPKKKKTVLFIVLFIIIVFLVAGVVWGYTYIFQSPEKVLAKMFENISDIKTFEYAGEISSNHNNDILQNFILGLQGKVDISVPDSPKTTQLINFIVVEPQSGDELDFEIELKSLNKITYIRINKTPESIPGFPLGDLKTDLFINQWIEFNPDDINQQFLQGGASPDFENSSNQLSFNEKNEQIKTAVIESGIIGDLEQLKGEVINQVKTYHYKIVLDKEKLKDLFKKITEIQFGADQERINFYQFLLDSLIDKMEMSEFEIWIGNKDHLPYKLSLKNSINQENEDPVNLLLLIHLNNYNKMVEITEPQNVKTAEEVFSSLTDINSYAGLSESDYEIDTDEDGLSDYLESLFQTDPNNPDSDGDGFLDGDEVENGYNPMGEGVLDESEFMLY